jgi:hypothetical protein
MRPGNLARYCSRFPDISERPPAGKGIWADQAGGGKTKKSKVLRLELKESRTTIY